MSRKCGIVGLPNIGKSTLFNIFVGKQQAEVANYPFCTIDPNNGIAIVKDERLDKLAEKGKSKKIIYNHINVCDIAGLVEGASNGEGLGNKFLGNILEVDLIIHVVRLFQNDDMPDVEDPIFDFEIIEYEIMQWDMKRVEEMLKKNKKNDGDFEILNNILECLQNNKYPPKSHIPLISSKPKIVLGNGTNPKLIKQMEEFCEKRGLLFFHFDFHNSDQDESLNLLIKKAYESLGLISFFTCGEKEARAWSVKQNTNYKDAALEIHTDIHKGFICAQVVPWNQFGSTPPVMKKANDIVNDGDVIVFKHNG